MSDDDAGQGRGRPQKFPGEGARISHSLRLKPAVADRLRVAALAANRTLGEEMELRINMSFEQEDRLKELVEIEIAKRSILTNALMRLSIAQANVDASFRQYCKAGERRESAYSDLQRAENELAEVSERKYADVNGYAMSPPHHKRMIADLKNIVEARKTALQITEAEMAHADTNYNLETLKLEAENQNYREVAGISGDTTLRIEVRGFHETITTKESR